MKQRTPQIIALDQARITAGSARELAEKLTKLTGIECATTMIGQWKHRGQVPAKWVIPIEKITGIERSRLRPDLYPLE